MGCEEQIGYAKCTRPSLPVEGLVPRLILPAPSYFAFCNVLYVSLASQCAKFVLNLKSRKEAAVVRIALFVSLLADSILPRVDYLLSILLLLIVLLIVRAHFSPCISRGAVNDV